MTDDMIPMTWAGFFPLEVAEPDLAALLTGVVDNNDVETLSEGVEWLLKQAMIGSRRDSVSENPKITDPGTLATLTALATLRVEIADPHLSLTGDHRPSKQYLKTPLQTNPGLSQIAQHVRDYYVNTLIGLLGTHDDQSLLTEAATILFAFQPPRISSFPDGPLRFYTDLEQRDRDNLRNRSVQISDESITIPIGAATERCRAPAHDDALPELTTTDNQLHIPRAVLRAKLRPYARHGYNKLLHTAFHTIPPYLLTELKHHTPDFRNRLGKKFQGHEGSVYEALYTSATKHPNATRTENGLVPDRRIVGIVNTISATPNLEFNHFYTASELADAARNYFPPPHQPSLSQLTSHRISQTLKSMAEKYGDTTGPFAHSSDLHYLDIVRIADTPESPQRFALRAPTYSPLYTAPAPDFNHPWNAYKQLLTKQARNPLPDASTIRAALDEHAPSTNPTVTDAKQEARRTIATTPHKRSLAAIKPHTTLARINDATDHDKTLSHDELLFLTRIAYALQHRVRDTTISDGMAQLDTNLDVDPGRLAETNWLERHENPRHTLYSLSEEVMRNLNIPPTTNETYGDAVFEKALHRFCTYDLKTILSQKPTVDTVYTYYNLWRLNYTKSEIQDAIQAHDVIELDVSGFRNSRADVIAFDATGSVTDIGEVQTASNSRAAPTRNWDKLAVLADHGVTPHWYCPTGDHAGDTLEKLYNNDRIDASSIYSTTDLNKYSPSKWRDWLATHDPDNIAFPYENLHALRSS